MLKRNTTIDSIRGVAIALVLIHHICVQCQTSHAGSISNIINFLLYPFVTGGWVAVDLFFVLSGFLISGLLFKEYERDAKIDFGRFLVRRSFKIYPGFFAFLSISLLVSTLAYHFLGGTRPYFRGYIYDALFLHNYINGPYGTTWSLDVEEAFYILLPIFFGVIINRKALKFRTIITTYLVLVVIGITGRILAVINYPVYNFEKRFTQTHYRLDALFFGVVLSYLYHYHKPMLKNTISKFSTYMIPFCFLLISLNFVFPRDHNNWISIIMLSINPICFGMLMILLVEGKPRFLEKYGWLKLLGVNSYAIYLWHPLVNNILIDSLLKNNSEIKYIVYIFAYLLLSVSIGVAATMIIEKPMLHFRDKHFNKKISQTTRLNFINRSRAYFIAIYLKHR